MKHFKKIYKVVGRIDPGPFREDVENFFQYGEIFTILLKNDLRIAPGQFSEDVESFYKIEKYGKKSTVLKKIIYSLRKRSWRDSQAIFEK